MLKTAEPKGLAADAAARAQRLREAIALHEIEGNPLDAEQIAMFEMFEREGWSDERALAYILALHQRPA